VTDLVTPAQGGRSRAGHLFHDTSVVEMRRPGDAIPSSKHPAEVSRNVRTDGGTERRAVGQKRLPGWTIVAVVGEPRNTEGRAGVFS
jgi:hypothetical protein